MYICPQTLNTINYLPLVQIPHPLLSPSSMWAHTLHVSYSGTVQWGDLPTLQGQWDFGGPSDGFRLSPERSLLSFSGEWKGNYEQSSSKHEIEPSVGKNQTTLANSPSLVKWRQATPLYFYQAVRGRTLCSLQWHCPMGRPTHTARPMGFGKSI